MYIIHMDKHDKKYNFYQCLLDRGKKDGQTIIRIIMRQAPLPH